MSRSHSVVPASYRPAIDADQTGRFDLLERPGQQARNRVAVAAQKARDAAADVAREIERFWVRMGKLDDDWRSRPKRALIVDDNTGSRIALRAVLEDMFETIDEADDSISAHVLTKEHYYDIVIADVRLKGEETGIELVYRIRQRSQHPNVPILMISGRDEGEGIEGKLVGDELGRWSDRSGANAWLEKTRFSNDELRHQVQELLSEERPRTRLRK